MSANVDLNQRPDYDAVLQDIADYVLDYRIDSTEALDTARNCLMDTLGCGLLALRFPECTKHPARWSRAPWSRTARGCRAPPSGSTRSRPPGTSAASSAGWTTTTPGWPPSGAIPRTTSAASSPSPTTSQKRLANGEAPLSMRQVLEAMIMAHEIQGVIALENSFNRVGLDHVLLVKVASTAVCAKLMGADREQLLAALSHAFVDGQALRTYRHAPNAGSRKSWAAGDATSRGVRLADIALRGEMGIPGVLSAPQWGFYDVLFSHSKDLATKPEDKRRFSFPRATAAT